MVRAAVNVALRQFGHSHAVSANFPNLPAAIAAYCSKSGQTQASLSRALKLSRATVTRWIQGDEPEVKRLKEIAKELGVSVGYLAADDEVAHNDDEIDLLKGYREQPERVKRLMRQLAREDDDSP